MRSYLLHALSGLVLAATFSCSTPKETDENQEEPKAKSDSGRIAKNFFGDCKKLFAEARRMDSVLLGQTEIDKTSANEAIHAFTDFAYYCKSDSMSPVYLIKTAQVARAINNIPQAKKALDHCVETYPSFRNRPAALFLLAQLYDENTYLNNEQEAKKLYEQIINDYPKSDWAMSARGAITFLGKTDEEILKELKKKK